MIKRIAMVALLSVGGFVASSSTADAAVYFRRVAPVRHVAARTVLPPYPVARRAVVGPVYRRPIVGYGFGAPVIYAPPVVVGGGVVVW